MCTVCNGIGHCPVCSPEPEPEVCEKCEGTGYLFFYENPTSQEIIEVSKYEYERLPQADCFKEQCDACDGEGYKKEDLPTSFYLRQIENHINNLKEVS